MARTLEEQTNSLAAYLPLGKLWGAKNQEDTVTRGLLQGLSGELIRNSALLAEYREEILPDRTVLFLSEWERALGIPDDCFTGVGTDDERRNDILAKLTSLGVQSAEDMRLLALQVYNIDITIKNPRKSGENVFPYTFNPTGEEDGNGDGGSLVFNLSDREARFQIIIQYNNLPIAVLFPFTFPISFGTRESKIIECLLTKLRPANVGFTKETLIPAQSPIPPTVPPIIIPDLEIFNPNSVHFIDTGDTDTGCRSLGWETDTNHDMNIPHNTNGTISMSIWAKRRESPGGTMVFFKNLPSGASSNEFSIQDGSNGKIDIRFRSGATNTQKFYESSLLNTLDEWFHFVVTFDGTNGANAIRMYVDGVLDTTPTKTTDQDISSVVEQTLVASIGGKIGIVGPTARHNVHSVATWDVVLGATEVTEIYNDGAGKHFDLQTDVGNYTSSADMQSWWLVGNKVIPNICDDQQGLLHLNTLKNVVNGDIEEDAPGF